MPEWIVAFILKKKRSALSESDIDGAIKDLVEEEFSDVECHAIVDPILIRELNSR